MKDYGIVKIKSSRELGIIKFDENSNMKFLSANEEKQSCYCSDDLPIIQENNIIQATHDEKIEYLKQIFSWGEITQVYSMGEYIIFKYISPEGTMYYPYINYKDVGRSYDKLDQAIVGLITYKYDGENTQADRLICNMLNIK